MEHITLITNPEECTGCGACAAVCPKKAITLQPDQVGAVYPVIEEAACVRCGQCLRICPEGKAVKVLPHTVYAGTASLPQLQSASGGIFAVVSRAWAAAGGLVAGAVLQDGEVYHVLSKEPEQLAAMQGSKYTHSSTEACLRQVQEALRAGMQVLFSGTPCQVAAIKALTGDPENLTTIDLICHGVTPNAMLRDFLKLLGKRIGGAVTDFSFRDKQSPKAFTARFTVWGKVYRLRPRFLSYYQHFLEGTTYRENCYRCSYAGRERVADITIGDYWGVDKHHTGLPQRTDWSCVLVNTEKGEKCLSWYGGDLLLYPSQLEWAAEQNGQLNMPSKPAPNRSEVLQAYATGGYPAVERLFVRSQGGRIRFFYRMTRELMK